MPAPNPPEIGIVRLPHSHDLPLPSYQTPGSAGMDLQAACTDDLLLEPGSRVLVPTGLIFELPDGHEAQIRPRSGLALKHGVTVLNAPGTIDSDYRGEIMVLLVNLGNETFRVARGMRIAQVVIAPCVQPGLTERSLAGDTARGTGGFGSTGS